MFAYEKTNQKFLMHKFTLIGYVRFFFLNTDFHAYKIFHTDNLQMNVFASSLTNEAVNENRCQLITPVQGLVFCSYLATAQNFSQ